MYHFAPTQNSRENLLREGIRDNHIFVTGNTVIDALLAVRDRIMQDKACWRSWMHSIRLSTAAKMILVTGHRRESFGGGFERICHALAEIATTHPEVQIVYPVHLNPNVSEPVKRILHDISNIVLISPQDYLPLSTL